MRSRATTSKSSTSNALSLEARGLTEDDLIVDVTVLDAGDLGKLMAEQDVVLSF